MLDTIAAPHDLTEAKMAQDLNVLDPEALREKVREHVDSNQTTMRGVAALAGVAESTFTAWVNGKYSGNNEKVEERVRIWLKSDEVFAPRRKAALKKLKFAHTSSAQKIINALEHAQAVPDIAVISTVSGVGKTKTCNYYRETRPNVWVLTADPSMASHGKMLDRLRQILSIPKMNPHNIGPAVAEKLRNSQALIIVDEADHLNPKSFEMLRCIYDLGNVGIAFLGNAEVWGRIDGGGRNAELARVFSRVGVRVTISKSSDKDIEIVLDTLEIIEPKLRTILKAIAGEPGALRAVEKVLRLAWTVADGAGEALSETHLLKSWSRFTGRKIGAA